MKKFIFTALIFFLNAFLFLNTGSIGFAEEEFYCEVLGVEGSVTVTSGTSSGKPLVEGDLLKVEDVVTVSSDSYVDLAYDKDWNNITRVEENSKVRLKSIVPASLELEQGGVFAKLKALPKDSSFEVKTPTAIASVRGTEYRTTYISGETQIFNVSSSDVYVYGVESSGQRSAEPVILKNSEVTQVQRMGQRPSVPRRMMDHEFQPVKKFQQGIENKVRENISRGRVGKIQDIQKIQRFNQLRRQERTEENRLDSDDREKMKDFRGDVNPGARPHRENNAGNPDQHGSQPSGVDGKPVRARAEKPNLGEPYFPGGERSRSGGPQPTGLSRDQWKSGAHRPGAESVEKNNRQQGNSRPRAKTQNANAPNRKH